MKNKLSVVATIIATLLFAGCASNSPGPNKEPLKIELESAGNYVDGVKPYNVTSISKGATWSDVNVTLGCPTGQCEAPQDPDGKCTRPGLGQYVVCNGGVLVTDADPIRVGDTITIHVDRQGNAFRIRDVKTDQFVFSIKII